MDAKKTFEYRGYKITLTGNFGMCWDLWAETDDLNEEDFEIPGIGCEAKNLEELFAEAKEIMDENIYDDD
jgi:hypothetical protein